MSGPEMLGLPSARLISPRPTGTTSSTATPNASLGFDESGCIKLELFGLPGVLILDRRRLIGVEVLADETT